MPWTTDDLLATVRRDGYLPDAFDLSSADLLAFGNDELATTFADVLKTSREEYRVKRYDLPLVSGTTRYRLPRRCLARTVRGISYVDSLGNEGPAIELPALESWRYQANRYGAAQAYYVFEGDELVLPVAPSTAGASLRVRYVQRFPRLVLPSACTPITGPNSPGLSLTVGEDAPSAVSSTDALIDIVSGDSPFEALYTDLVVASYSSTTLALTTAVDVDEISDSSSIGARLDYVCPRDSSCYPPLPQEMHGVLALAIVRRVLEALGDPRVSIAESTLRSRLERSINVAEPRNQDRKPRIIDRGGRLRGNRRVLR